MRQTFIFTILFFCLTLQNGLSQNARSMARQNDTTSAGQWEENCRHDSLLGDSTKLKLFRAWFGSGEAGDGAWFGPRTPHAIYFFTDSGKANMSMHRSGKVSFANSIKINGTTTTKILTVTGGADLAEPFLMTEKDSIPDGAIVVIDERNPGKLKLCRKAYDSRVAGVVSGAAGVNSGLILQQEEKLGEGRNVALNGRVYALATAANGSIRPGDLLTTSDVPGHAMKATDKTWSHGAILGKALSELAAGEGLVLVLVNLQ